MIGYTMVGLILKHILMIYLAEDNDKEATSDYNTNYGLSDDMFLKIQQQMRENQDQKTIDEPSVKLNSESSNSKKYE
jgi:hypothetical protein